MFRFRFPALLILLGSALTALAGPPTVRADKARSFISYTGVHSLHEWTGVNKNLDAVAVLNPAGDQITKVAVSCKVAEFDSGNSSRDSHALEVLEALKFPKVTFVSTAIVPEGPNLRVTGNLNFHGVTRAVSFVANRQEPGKDLAFKGDFSIQLTDYNIDRPTFMLVPMDNAMKLEFVMVFPK